jgi:hypothetical protein
MQTPTHILLQTFVLEERSLWYPGWLPVALILSIALVGFIRIMNAELIGSVFNCLFTRPTSSTNFREAVAIQGKTSYFLLLNFLISGSLLIFISSNIQEQFNLTPLIYVLPFLILFYPLLSMSLTGLITGEMKRIRENFHMYSMSLQLFGLLLIPTNIILLLNPRFLQDVLWVMLSVFIVIYLVRCYRGINYAINNKVSWYYLILYLCGLEILPWMILFEYTWK